MSVLVRKIKKLKECDMSGTCGGDAGMVTPSMSTPFSSAATNIGGMGNPVPPTENSYGSGDNFGGSVHTIATQTPPILKSRFKVRKKKKK